MEVPAIAPWREFWLRMGLGEAGASWNMLWWTRDAGHLDYLLLDDPHQNYGECPKGLCLTQCQLVRAGVLDMDLESQKL